MKLLNQLIIATVVSLAFACGNGSTNESEDEKPDIYDNESHDGENGNKGEDAETPGGEEREERVVTKVRDLLAAENHSSALNIGRTDLEKMFNLQMPQMNTYKGKVDVESKRYYEKIQMTRETQKKLLPLYLES